MNIKILVVAPYEGLKEVFKQVMAANKNFIEIVVGNLEEGLAYVKERGEEQYDVIISRGGTAELIQRNVSVPVVDIQVSGYDMLRVLKMVSSFPGKAAIVGFPNISHGAATVCSLLELDILNLTIQSGQEVRGVLQGLADKGYELVIGDVVTVNTAKEMGLTGILITSGIESVVESVDKAEKTYRLFSGLRKELNLYKAILKESKLATLIIDQSGNVITHNEAAAKLLQKMSNEQVQELKEQGIATIPYSGTITIEETLFNYDIKPVQVGDGLHSVFIFQEDQLKNEQIAGVTIEKIHAVPSLAGKSETISSIKSQVEVFSQEKRPILIEGENGTGKKLLASIIHKQGRSAHLGFMTVDCKVVPDGHWVKLVDYLIKNYKTLGTVYFKGIDEINLQAQIELLRLSEICGKVRVVSSSTTSIREKVQLGKFQSDLFTLFSKISIFIPPLIDRIEDLEPLTHMFISFMHSTHSTHVIGIRKEGVELLQAYSWPGNVEELKQIIEQLIIQSKGYYIEKEEVEQLINNLNTEKSVAKCDIILEGTLEEIEKRIIRRILEEEDMNQSRAAKRLGINRSTLWRKLK